MSSLIPVDASGGVVYTRDVKTTQDRQATQDCHVSQGSKVSQDRQATQGRQAVQDRQDTQGHQATQDRQASQSAQAFIDGEDDPWVLLIYRRGVWDLPKGKREEGEAFETCAVREVAEETGARTELRGHLIDTVHEYEMEGERYRKTTRWFSMELLGPEQQLTPEKEEDIHALEWVPLSEAMERVGFENLVQVLNVFDTWWRSRL